MFIATALLLAVIAGIINGSFALPTKYLNEWSFERIWLQYAIWAFLLLPWVSLLIMDSHAWVVYKEIVPFRLLIILIGGLIFGIGQACFAKALKMIGLGIGFVINIGLATSLGALAPLLILYPSQIITPFGMVIGLGALVIILGLVVVYRAGKNRTLPMAGAAVGGDASRVYKIGVLLAVIAGFSSAIQNFVFAISGAVRGAALLAGIHPLAASVAMWPPFLTCALIPYAVYMLCSRLKNKVVVDYVPTSAGAARFFVLTLVMGAFFYGSLIFYSQSSMMLGYLGPVIAWPIFMTLIILTSNFWGWRHKEWLHASQSSKRQAVLGVLILVFAVVLLAYGVTLKH